MRNTNWLEQAVNFNIYHTSELPQVREITHILYAEVRTKLGVTRKENRYQDAIQAILLNLYATWRVGVFCLLNTHAAATITTTTNAMAYCFSGATDSSIPSMPWRNWAISPKLLGSMTARRRLVGRQECGLLPN